MSAFPQILDAPAAAVLSIALIGPEEQRRNEVAGALADVQNGTIREFSSYPPDLVDLPRMLDRLHDVILVDLDCDPDYAFDLVQSICAHGSATVMVYSARADLELAIRCMRAGAREFFTLPLAANDMSDALARISVRRPGAFHAKRAGKLFVFLGAKGGCGVTTLASNFAISLAQESGQKTMLIDLGLPLGDAAINLGMAVEYSTHNALHDSSRLDANFLSSLLATHSSGLSVLAAPGEFPRTETPMDAVNKLLAVARQNFDYVVVDAGSRLDLKDSALFDASAIIYLVTQVGISELRNANRLVTRFFASRDGNLQIVLNRYTPRALLFDETHITKALTRPAQWRIPDDFASARRTRNTATPLALEDSPISIAIRQMARKACGLPESPEKKKGFSIFGISL
ncbi:MAG TPA: AAA family ATPase [Terracidiphilus sp.]|nr:AAA family ATPase [Terracidiphilus sp.]